MDKKSQKEITLKRELSLFTSTLLVAGLVVGSGIFMKIVPMAKTGLGEMTILLAWTAAGVISLLGALTVGGLANLTEESGGTYEYFRIAFGKFFAFVSGWSDFMIVGTGVNAAIAFLCAQTVNSIIPLPNPLEAWEHISIANYIYPFANSGIKILGILTIVLLTAVNCLGARESGLINNIITSAKILGILMLIVLGLAYSKPGAEAEIISVSSPESWSFMSGFLTAMLAALWAYDGWIYPANISGEIINPRRNLPLALIFGILLTIVLYIAVNYVYMYVLSLEEIRSIGDNEIGALPVAEVIFGSYGKLVLQILILVCSFGALNGNIISLPRKYYRMAQEGYFFRNAAKVHPRFRTPVIALIYSMVWSCILLLSGSFDMLSDMVVFTAFMFYGLLAVALIKLKRTGTIKKKVAGYPVVPVLFLLFSIALTVHTIGTEPAKSAFGLLLILSSIPFYFFFRYSGKAL